ncbi:MAG: metal-dependent transcriptional regulator [Bacteroidales bacterium]|nr:metal-dependent transcriptional regulator [Bacteroidales bacterium]
MSVSTENFIKAIYLQNQREGTDVKPGTLAKMLRITNAASTDMARSLAAKNLIVYTKYKPLSLTPEGQLLAMNVLRKHRLWETFLHQTLQLSLHEIHREAEMLEHFTSDFLSEKIDCFLGYPATDPHGDPIPTADGQARNDAQSIALSTADAGKIYTIVRLFSSDADFFDFCAANHIALNSEIKLERHFEHQKMSEISIKGQHLVLNETFTKVIYVQTKS